MVVIGDGDPCFEQFLQAFAGEPRIRARNLAQNHGAGGAVPRNHGIRMAAGALIAYLDDDNEWLPDHVSSVYEAMRSGGASFGFSSMQVAGRDLFFTRPEFQGIDTSCVIHDAALIPKYGEWKDRSAGYHHDWEIVSRWVAGGERWRCTGRPTLLYNAEFNGQKAFFMALSDRREKARGAAPAATSTTSAKSGGARLCAHMIVRNEAAIIERALRSAAGVADCCVICDTGSTDGTQAIIQSFCSSRGIPCELHEFPFVDFAQARNEGLERARRSPLAFDYLLLFDADMELRVDDPGALARLRADAALVRQESAALAYHNVRLLRRGARARYVGAAHEVLAVDGEVIRCEGLSFFDHADGASRADKLARDERLLRAALERDPGDLRAQFYLAQTLRDAGRFAEAADWFARRFAAGGWEEERWHACYQMALCRLGQGDAPGFVAGCLDAYALRPTRAEPLWRLARHYAGAGQHDAALLLFEQVLRMPRPDNDILFVEREAYGDAVREAIAVSGFYSALPERRDAGRRACEALAIDAGAAPRSRLQARDNLHFYARPLAAVCAGTALHALAVELPAPLAATNPSFARDGAGYLGVVRGVNYRLHQGRYEIFDDAGCVRTRNFLVRLGADFALAGMREIRDLSTLPRFEASRIRGFEDCRLFRWNGGWWCSATARDLSADGRATMALLRLDAAGDIAQAHVLRGYGDAQHQKNWMPVVDSRLRFVYSAGPAIVLDASAGDGSFTVESGIDPGIAIDHWRGGPPLLPWGTGHLALVHEARDTAQGREYAHRFVALDDRCVAVAASDAFHFRARGVEFAAGLAPGRDAAEVVVSFGADDCSAWLATIPVAAVRAALRPVGVYAGGRAAPA